MKTTTKLFAIILMFASGVLCAFYPVHSGYHIGDIAADFELKSTNGDMVSMGDFEEAKGFVIVFTCNHCPFAVMYEDRLIELNDKYAPQGYPVIAINPNDPDVQPADSYEAMQERAEEKAFTFPYLFDEGQNVYPKFGATRTPHVFLLDETRKVRYIGAIDDNHKNADAVEEKYLENAIEALKRGEAPDPSETKAIGCSIKKK